MGNDLADKSTGGTSELGESLLQQGNSLVAEIDVFFFLCGAKVPET